MNIWDLLNTIMFLILSYASKQFSDKHQSEMQSIAILNYVKKSKIFEKRRKKDFIVEHKSIPGIPNLL